MKDLDTIAHLVMMGIYGPSTMKWEYKIETFKSIFMHMHMEGLILNNII